MSSQEDKALLNHVKIEKKGDTAELL